MQGVFLVLQCQVEGRPMPIARSTDPRLLRAFKRRVLKELRGLARGSEDGEDVPALILGAELQKMERILGAVIPEEQITSREPVGGNPLD